MYCKPRQEILAETNLGSQGYRIYLPRATQEKRRGGRWMELIEPLFPRYLFIQLSTTTDNWSPIRSTRGVAGLVRFGDEPALAPDGLVEAMISRENSSGLHRIEMKKINVGDTVRVRTGSMSGYEGIFLARNSRDRVIVLLNIVEKSVRVSLAPDAIELAG
ncbi:MAG: transcription/translation regulatory transformer protein RfaH [Pseudomonadota bacterium]